jgi:hypothetical protein
MFPWCTTLLARKNVKYALGYDDHWLWPYWPTHELRGWADISSPANVAKHKFVDTGN